MSFPAILALEDGSVFYGSGFGKEKFDATLSELRSERDTVKSLGLL